MATANNNGEGPVLWKSYLYQLQQQAPTPKLIECIYDLGKRPDQYGREFHGLISRDEAERQVAVSEGGYLVRESQRAPGSYSLTMRFDNESKHYKLFFDGKHFIADKHFDSVYDLVADGLITMYIEKHASDYIEKMAQESLYEESPYMTLHLHQQKLKEKHQLRAKRRRKKHHQQQKQQSSSIDGKAQEIVLQQQTSIQLPSDDTTMLQQPQTFVSQSSEDIVQAEASVSQSSDDIVQPPTSVSHTSNDIVQPQTPVSQPSNDMPQQQTTTPHSSNYMVQPQTIVHEVERPSLERRKPGEVGELVESERASGECVEEKPESSTSETGVICIQPVRVAPPPPPRHSAGGKKVRSPNVPPRVRLPSGHANTDADNSVMAKSHELSPVADSTMPIRAPAASNQSPPPITDNSRPTSFASSDSQLDDDLEFVMEDTSAYEKSHIFKMQTFRGMNWCFLCGNFLWGLVQQGVKCVDCGFIAHKKCSEKVPNDCLPDLKYVKRVFGVDLTTLVKAYSTPIPVVVEKCVTEIEARGLLEEGIYRVPGFSDDIEYIKAMFDRDAEKVNISRDHVEDINTICGVLKLYLRLLPIPVIPYDVYNDFIECAKLSGSMDSNHQVENMKTCVRKLPPAHYQLLKYVLVHLLKVAEHSSVNMMTPDNISIVFGPTLLCSANPDPMARLVSNRYEGNVIDILLKNYGKLFAK